MRMRYNLFLWKGFLPTKPGCYQSSACSSVDQVLKLPFTYSVELTGKQSVMSQVSIFTGNPCKLESCIEPSTCLGLAKYATETRIMKIPAGSHFQGLTLEATNSSVPEGNEKNTQESSLHLIDKLLSLNVFNLQCSMADAVKPSFAWTSHTWWNCFSQHCLAALTNYSGIFFWLL